MADERTNHTGRAFGSELNSVAEAVNQGKLAVADYGADGAVAAYGHMGTLSKGTAGAYTLAAPTEDGHELVLTSTTAAAHVVTATGLLQNGATGGAKNTLTFAAFPGATATLRSVGGDWHVSALVAVTVA